MKLHTLTFHLSLLIVAAPAWGQSPPQPVGNEVRRPLNLSLPREVAKPAAVVSTEADDMTIRNLQKEVEEAEKRLEQRQPYGTGYEARQRAIFSGSGNPGFGGGFGDSAGGGGYGGMGRGR